MVQVHQGNQPRGGQLQAECHLTQSPQDCQRFWRKNEILQNISDKNPQHMNIFLVEIVINVTLYIYFIYLYIMVRVD